MNQHRHEEFLKFLRTVDKEVPKGLAVHMILNNYATHKHKDVVAWLTKHPRFQLHNTATSSSWTNLVERCFRELTKNSLRRGRLPRGGPGDMSPGTDWREAFAGYLHRLRAVLRSHPNVLPAIATRPVTSAHMLATLDTVVARLTAEGFSDADAIDTINCMGTYTIRHAMAEVGQPVGGESEDPHSIWSAMSPEEFPHLVAIFSDGYEYSADAQYELGLTAMLDGMAVRLATRYRPHRRPRPAQLRALNRSGLNVRIGPKAIPLQGVPAISPKIAGVWGLARRRVVGRQVVCTGRRRPG